MNNLNIIYVTRAGTATDCRIRADIAQRIQVLGVTLPLPPYMDDEGFTPPVAPAPQPIHLA